MKTLQVDISLQDVKLSTHHQTATGLTKKKVAEALKQAWQDLKPKDLPVFSENLILKKNPRISLIFMQAESIQQINLEYRNQDKPTNVLSFPCDDPWLIEQTGFLGEILVCLPVLIHEAEQQNKTIINHTTHLLIHGLLHLAGCDHIEADEAQIMESLEIACLAKQGISNPYEINSSPTA
jgi:probable rRNA maturation factor